MPRLIARPGAPPARGAGACKPLLARAFPRVLAGAQGHRHARDVPAGRNERCPARPARLHGAVHRAHDRSARAAAGLSLRHGHRLHQAQPRRNGRGRFQADRAEAHRPVPRPSDRSLDCAAARPGPGPKAAAGPAPPAPTGAGEGIPHPAVPQEDVELPLHGKGAGGLLVLRADRRGAGSRAPRRSSRPGGHHHGRNRRERCPDAVRPHRRAARRPDSLHSRHGPEEVPARAGFRGAVQPVLPGVDRPAPASPAPRRKRRWRTCMRPSRPP